MDDAFNVKKQLTEKLSFAYKDFKKNPSASNYVKLERAMLRYQNYLKNRDHYAAGG